MAGDDNASHSVRHEHHEHASGRCPDCGREHRIERSYKADDRMLRALLPPLAHQMGLQAFYKGRKTSTTIYVSGPDAASLDRFDTRLVDLAARLDAELMKVATAFVKEHVGVDLKVRLPG